MKTDERTDVADPAGFELLGRLHMARIIENSENSENSPSLGADALTGLAGDIVTELAPLTEATPAAMLVTLLSTFGAMCGRNAHALVGAKPHYPNIFVVVVGATSKDRKGTSAAAVRPIIEASAEGLEFLAKRRLEGFGSGEAVIQAATEAGTLAGVPVGNPVPDGFDSETWAEPDQRLLVFDEEFAGRTLNIANRQGSILSAVLRCAWDGEPLASRTRKETLEATAAHIGIIAHATAPELKRNLASVDIANGFGNRLVFAHSQRTMLHPVPRRLPQERVTALGARLADALRFARRTGHVPMSPEFQQEWDRVYRTVESRPTGGELFDSLTARASAQLLRFSLIYALLDLSPQMTPRHLRAALALWHYSEASVAHIWGATSGDPRMDALVRALADAGASGLPRAELSAEFSNNLSKEQLDVLTRRAIELGYARAETQATGGRPRQVLISVT